MVVPQNPKDIDRTPREWSNMAMFEDDFEIQIEDVVDDEEQAQHLVEWITHCTLNPGGWETQMVDSAPSVNPYD